MPEPENPKPLKDKFTPRSAQDCGMEEAFDHGLLRSPSPGEEHMRPQPRPERSHNHD